MVDGRSNVDEFDDAFFDEDSPSQSSSSREETSDHGAKRAGVDRRGEDERNDDDGDGGGDDAISISSSSSSSSSSDDGDGSSSSSSSGSSSDGDDDSVETRPNENERCNERRAPAKKSNAKATKMEKEEVKSRGAHGDDDGADDDDDDLLDSVLDDDNLAEFFSESAKKKKKKKNAYEDDDEASFRGSSATAAVEERSARTKTDQNRCHGLDSLDDDALAELEEDFVIDIDEDDDAAVRARPPPPAVDRGKRECGEDGAETTTEEKPANNREFEIVGHKSATRPSDPRKVELVDDASDVDGEFEGAGTANDKENCSPNGGVSSHTSRPKEKQRRRDRNETKSDEILELFGNDCGDSLATKESSSKGSATAAKVDSPSSLDTPCKNPNTPSLTPTRPIASKDEAAARTPVNPYQNHRRGNPYQKQQRQRQYQRQQHRTTEISKSADIESQSSPSKDSNNDDTTPASNDATTQEATRATTQRQRQGRTTKEMTKGTESKLANRDFTISYNGETRPSGSDEEELVDDESDDEFEQTGGMARNNKENHSPNSIEMSPHYATTGRSKKERRRRNDKPKMKKKSDEVPELFDNDADGDAIASHTPKRSPSRESLSSLDTPREDPSVPSLTPTQRLVGSEDKTAAGRPANPYRARRRVDPCQKQQQHQQQRQMREIAKGGDVENDSVPSKDSKSGDTAHANSDTAIQRDPSKGLSKNTGARSNTDAAIQATSEAIVLPDIDTNPNAQQTEVQRLGIDRSQFKPPPHRTHDRREPIIHRLNSQTRRRTVAVDRVFSLPIRNLWKGKFTQFNHVQSEMADVLANSDDNVIVSAPTGAGKTALFEMALARLFSSRDPNLQPTARKAVYVAPNKALCEERQADWSRRLSLVDPSMVCATVTGDNGVDSSRSWCEQVAGANLILTTPEKWDSITRKWNDQFVLLACIKLVLVDEVHMIGEAGRGGCLESVICRMKTIARASRTRMLTTPEIASSSYKNTTPGALTSNMRVVAVSATLPNLGQLASFVESGEAYVFDQSYRPVPLNIYVQACGHIGKNRYMFDKSLSQHVPGILKNFSNGRPAIVFCHSKKETETLAEELSTKYAYANNPSKNATPALIDFAAKAGTAALQRVVRRGIAFHHAGVDASDRRLVEEAFSSGAVSCLCATSTLAMGINLPSHLVVVKGTSAYRGAEVGHEDIDTGTLLQMMGRAGRPGFDKSGTAVIMTDSMSKTRYENVSQGLKVVESHLMTNDKLTEVLNIEISQGVIVSVEEAVDWVKGTFLYQRIQSNPLVYGFKRNYNEADLHSFVLDNCTDAIDKLLQIGCITVQEDGKFYPNAGCHVMSRNFISFETMKAITKLPHDSGPVQLLHMMANCGKIQTEVRRSEKKHLNEAYKKIIRYKLEGPQSKIRIQTKAEKAFVMIQSAIGQHYFQDHSLRQQMSNMIDVTSQILSAVEQYSREGSLHGQVATQATLFRRAIYSGLWGENDGVLNQIGGVNQGMTAKLKESGISTFADAAKSSEEDIVNACSVATSFASSLRAAAAKILQRTLKLSACTEVMDDGRLELYVKLEQRTVGGTSEQTGGERVVSYSLFIFTDRAGGLLHCCEDVTMSFELKIQCPEKFGRAYIRLVSNLIGLDEQVTVDGNDRIEKSSFSLSPAAAPSTSKKGKKQGKLHQPPPTSRKRLFDTHRDSVSNVSDLRLHKRGKGRKEKEEDFDNDCIIVDAEAVEYSAPRQSKRAAQKSARKKLVTPSPHPRTNEQNSTSLTPVRNTASSSALRGAITNSSQHPQSDASGRYSKNHDWSKRTGTNNRKAPRNGRSSSWFQEKKQQKKVQQTAFNSPKENPFSSFSYDPNNIENSLDSNADKSKQPLQEQSIIPKNLSNTAYSTKKPRYSQTFRTPANNRRKSSAASKRISSVGLLHQKAEEFQQQHTAQAMTPRNYANHGSMQNNMTEAPSLHNTGFPAANRSMVQQHHGQSFQDPNQSIGPSHMVPQNSCCQRPGTSAGSAMMQQQHQYFNMAPDPPSTSLPFMAHSINNSMIAQRNNNYMMHGAMPGASRPMTSAGQSIASRLMHDSNTNFRQTNYAANMPQQQQFSTLATCDFQPQNTFQPQHAFQPQMQEFESFSSNKAPCESNLGFQHKMSQQQFGDTFNDPLCHGLDPACGNLDVGGANLNDPLFGTMNDGDMNLNVSHDPSFGNINFQQFNTQAQSQSQSQFGDGHHFGGGHTAVNPYTQQPPQQQGFPPNPYKKQPQHQSFPAHDGIPTDDMPPMQEVVVQNHFASQSGPGGDDASQFDDAFL